MSEEYQRLQEAARDVEREIPDLEQNHGVNSAAELALLERRLDVLAVKRRSRTKAMILLRSVSNPQFQEQQKEFVRQLPHKYHSQGPRRKVVHLPGGVTVTLNITYYHRQKDPAKASQKPERGVYPALMLLSISNALTPHVRRRMAKASALLGSYEEAAEMLSDDGITVSVNKLREVCGRIGRKLVQMTSSGSVQVEGNVKERRIVVSMDGGRVRVREPRKGRTRKGRKKFAANWREIAWTRAQLAASVAQTSGKPVRFTSNTELRRARNINIPAKAEFIPCEHRTAQKCLRDRLSNRKNAVPIPQSHPPTE